MPIIATRASAAYGAGFGKVLATGTVDTGVMFQIGMVQVGSAGSANVEFTSIPATYKHLQIRYVARTARANQEDNIYLRFNSDTGNNYAGHSLYGDGATASSFSEGTSISFNTRTVVAAASSSANTFGSGIIDILDYASTSKNKTARSFNGYDNNGAGQVRLTSGLWMNNTTAINSITILSANAANLVQYSSFVLYGIKGA
jgi:hypothetical protein